MDVLEKWILFCCLFLSLNVCFSSEAVTLKAPTEKIKNTLRSIFNEKLFAPVTDKYLTGEEETRRIAATRRKLEPIAKQHPEALAWYALQASEKLPKSYSFNYKARVLATELVSQQAHTAPILQHIAANQDAEWYVRREAINGLSRNQANEQLEALVPDLLDFQYSKKHDLNAPLHPNEEIVEIFLWVLGENKITAAIPAIKQLQERLKANRLAELEASYEDDEESAEANAYIKELSLKNLAYEERDFIIARAKLGDADVLPDVIKLSYADSMSARSSTTEALQQLTKQLGANQSLALLSGDTKEAPPEKNYLNALKSSKDQYVRRWALDQYIDILTKSDKPTPSLEIIKPLLPILNNDDSWHVTHRISTAIADLGEQDKPPIVALLKTQLQAESTSLNAKYWLVYSLVQLDEPVNDWMLKVKDIRVPLPSFISDNLRATIVNYWVPEAELKTDVRWLIENALANIDKTDPITIRETNTEEREPIARQVMPNGTVQLIYQTFDDEMEAEDQPDDENTDLVEINVTDDPSDNDNKDSIELTETQSADYQAEAIALALLDKIKAQSINTLDYLDYAEEMGQGGSTFYVIKMKPDHQEASVDKDDDEKVLDVESDHLHLSKLGPFIYYARHSETYHGDEVSSSGYINTISSEQRYNIYKQAALQEGLIWLDNEVLEYTFPGLNVYFFGDRSPLSIRNLLFYWQD